MPLYICSVCQLILFEILSADCSTSKILLKFVLFPELNLNSTIYLPYW